MAEVIYLSGQNAIPPKSINKVYLRQRYSCTFDPNAPLDERWLWRVEFTCTYLYDGSASTLDRAEKQARRRIDKLVNLEHAREESDE